MRGSAPDDLLRQSSQSLLHFGMAVGTQQGTFAHLLLKPLTRKRPIRATEFKFLTLGINVMEFQSSLGNRITACLAASFKQLEKSVFVPLPSPVHSVSVALPTNESLRTRRVDINGETMPWTGFFLALA
jgi:hypothetical protein